MGFDQKSLVVQGLRLSAPNTEDTGSMPVQGTKIPHAMWNNHKKCVVTFIGNELSRGGGGARCMTMPVQRQAVNW